MESPIDIVEVREALAKVSRGLYGRQFRLEVAAAIGAMPPPVWSRKVALALGIAENQVAREFRDFAELGALHLFQSDHDRRKTYQVVPHPLWESTRGLLERTIKEAYPADGKEIIRVYWASILDEPEPAAIPMEGG